MYEAKDKVELKFYKGDKVRIVDAGRSYVSYINAMNYFNVNEHEIYDRHGFSWTDFDGQWYNVENVCLNYIKNKRPLYIIHIVKD